MNDKDVLFLDTTLVDVSQDKKPEASVTLEEGGHCYFF